jgi:hypothetical protein
MPLDAKGAAANGFKLRSPAHFAGRRRGPPDRCLFSLRSSYNLAIKSHLISVASATGYAVSLAGSLYLFFDFIQKLTPDHSANGRGE